MRKGSFGFRMRETKNGAQVIARNMRKKNRGSPTVPFLTTQTVEISPSKPIRQKAKAVMSRNAGLRGGAAKISSQYAGWH